MQTPLALSPIDGLLVGSAGLGAVSGRGSRRLVHQEGPAIDHHPVAGDQLAAPTQLRFPVHLNVTPLDAVFGLTAGADKALELEELIQFHGRSAP